MTQQITIAGAKLRREAPGLYYWPLAGLWLVRTSLATWGASVDWVSLSAADSDLARDLAEHDRTGGSRQGGDRLRARLAWTWTAIHNSLRALVRDGGEVVND
jgi:hypothetical protein